MNNSKIYSSKIFLEYVFDDQFFEDIIFSFKIELYKFAHSYNYTFSV